LIKHCGLQKVTGGRWFGQHVALPAVIDGDPVKFFVFYFLPAHIQAIF
jgi:hypothetical protein